ncbi:response regulator transcription factor [uncultured Parasutterella sp.]|uniref:response regulator n=1 Tax=uncultured Parasutterella sp. TaxID=1263098 RepID=UPI0025965068|nr:response regulator transcription factor [uncultured Parasutterella sp.]
MIYCVEDDTDIREIEQYTLQSMKMETQVFADGTSFFAAVEKRVPDLVVLDIMLPDMSGIDILKRLRTGSRTRHVPVIMATAKGTEYERVSALDMGADDYLTKPFSLMEMVARINAVLRRCQGNMPTEEITFGSLSLDEASHEVKIDGKLIDLTLKEYELLHLMLKRQGRVFTRDQLLDHIWGTDYDGENRTVDVHIRTLRQKLGEMEYIIKTVRGVGYKVGS